MVTDREAKVWMVAALAVFVWACTMVGCTSSNRVGSTHAAAEASLDASSPLDNTAAATDAWLMPTAYDFDAGPLTITADPTANAWDAAADGQAISTASSFMMAELAPAQPELLRLTPREVPANLDLGLSGLSIAHPLLSAKRLLVAGVTQLHRLPQPVSDEAAFQVDRAVADTRPLAAAVFADQRTEVDAPQMEVPVELAGLVLEQPAWFIRGGTTPTPPSPLPTPAMGAAATAEEAKFDSAGIIGLVLGGMVLLFGGEAIVLWMLNRHQAAAKAKLHDALASDADDAKSEDDEPSIFRLPEPVKGEKGQDASRSRAA